MIKNLILLIFTLLKLNLLLAADGEVKNSGIRTIFAKRHDSAQSIAKEFLATHQTVYGEHINEYIKDLKKWNSDVTNWDNIPEGTELYLDYPYSPFINHNYAPKLSKRNIRPPVSEFLEGPLAESNKEQPSSFKFFSMLTISQANFNESISTSSLGSGNFQSTQNSPVTVGLGSNYLLSGVTHMINTSAYWSYINSSTLSGNSLVDQKVQPSPEIGANLYFQSFLEKLDFSVYEGIDYEKFSTINTKHFAAGDNFAIYSNQLTYATLGFGKTVSIFNQKTLLKVSFSQSISSSTSGQADDTFKGQRVLLFANLRGADKFSYHLLYKRHMLKGPTNLTINRIGIGLGYEFF